MNYDVIVVGCGFSGAVCARVLAEKFHKKVLILEKRGHIGGNMYDANDTNGVSVHWYGPHIFHTDSERVFEFVEKFSEWYPYEHTVLGKIDNKLVPIPFNFTSLEMLFSKDKSNSIKKKVALLFPNKLKVSVLDLINSEDLEIKQFGQYIYEKVFVNYTSKQWGVPPEKVDRSVINRVPVVLSHDSRYFQDTFQYMPVDGYTKVFENILNHPNISIKLNCDATENISLDTNSKKVYFDGAEWNNPVIYTGALDELINYQFGYLPYRSLDLCFEQHNVTTYQPVAVVNYPNEENFTRITEFKYLSRQSIDNSTTILKEYPLQYDPHSPKGCIPYYPIINEVNLALYKKHQDYVATFSNIFLCGRLAQYKYFNMDAVIEQALDLADIVGVNHVN